MCEIDVTAGYNGTVFAYGQTGSGKTFTMMVTWCRKYSPFLSFSNLFSLLGC